MTSNTKHAIWLRGPATHLGWQASWGWAPGSCTYTVGWIWISRCRLTCRKALIRDIHGRANLSFRRVHGRFAVHEHCWLFPFPPSLAMLWWRQVPVEAWAARNGERAKKSEVMLMQREFVQIQLGPNRKEAGPTRARGQTRPLKSSGRLERQGGRNKEMGALDMVRTDGELKQHLRRYRKDAATDFRMSKSVSVVCPPPLPSPPNTYGNSAALVRPGTSVPTQKPGQLLTARPGATPPEQAKT